MIQKKSDKELAFLHDLFVATDWGERFAELIDEHVTMPDKGHLLYVGAGTGSHAISLHERVGNQVEFLCLDENQESLELARAKAVTMKERAEFRQGKPDKLGLPDNQFDCVVGDGSLISPRRIPQMLAEMVRVAAFSGTVALVLPTASSFGEFFSIYWEAMHNCSVEHEPDVERLITQLPSISEMEDLAADLGLADVQSWVQIEEFDYDSGEEFLNSPLISDFLMPGWLESLEEEARERVADEVARLINEERHEAEFALSVKATLIVGRKSYGN